MSLLIDLFGYFSVVIHGLTITAQSIVLGGVLFIVLLLRPLAPQLGSTGQEIERTCIAIAAWSGLAVIDVVGRRPAFFCLGTEVWDGRAWNAPTSASISGRSATGRCRLAACHGYDRASR